jgi:hypothetical protein
MTPIRDYTRVQYALERHLELHLPSESSDPLALLATFALLSKASVAEPYEPKTLQEAKESSHWNQWEKVMKDEYDSLVENKA